MAYNQYIKMSDFYCTQCGGKGINIWRKRGQERPAGHLKKLFCLNCQQEQNFCEIKPFSTKYTYDDFLLEFNNHNFSKEGTRIFPFNEFKQKMVKEGKL